MTVDDLIQLLNASQQKPLTPLQQLVLRSAWEGKTYTIMAGEAHYGAQRIREVAALLWRSLSDFWGEPITKSNFRKTLESRPLSKVQQQLIDQYNRQLAPTPLEFPSGPVSLHSRFYIWRPPIEELAYSEITEPGCVIRIKAPSQMGKSSLMLRILDRATALGYCTASVDFQQAEAAVFTNIDKFLRWFCAYVSRQLKLESRIDEYWDLDMGSKVSCTIYFQWYVLQAIDSPLVLALNEVNRIFEYPEIAQEFLPLLRFWHEQAKQEEIWQKIRLIASYSTEIYIQIDLNQSPFNVGLPLTLPPFTIEQIQDLALRYGLDWTDGKDAKRLREMVGGHPYLVRLALYHLVNSAGSTLEKVGKIGGIKQLLQEAVSPLGIYHEHLQQLLVILQKKPELVAAFKQIISEQKSIKIKPLLMYKLDSMGLVTLQGDRCTPSCELYRLYFASKLLDAGERSSVYFQHLEQENQKLQELAHQDELTLIANRRYFERYLEQVWKTLALERKTLSLILGDIDHFRIYNKTHGRQAGDVCLQQIANTLNKIVRCPADLVARYMDEEFALILPDTTAENAFHVAEIIRRLVKELAIPHDISQVGGLPAPFITLSLGVASTIPEIHKSPIILVEAAEAALKQSKRDGRDRVTLNLDLK